ncbi:PREDICTED: uncharacterized protein LOC106808435 [Priapulus caudatus]|uniref:Uncharacterized protein LOC106808435 n=1 Tax=Priapulus caudatus TaxID=37621 RepID=A0ABM1E377_PRICU|nr:PREDICTED: uncharacterized protein LOC106808435 [Priapulus caudatus]
MDMKMRMYLIACLLLVLMANTASSLRCYTCTQSTQGAWNVSICQSDPAEVVTESPITDCANSTFCYTLLQMEDGLVTSFERGCGVENMSNKSEECIESKSGIRCDCATQCETDECNDDAGIPAGYTSPCLKPRSQRIMHAEQPHLQGIEGKDVEVNPYITIIVLVAGVVGGLTVVICVIIFCKYCITNKNVLKR